MHEESEVIHYYYYLQFLNQFWDLQPILITMCHVDILERGP